MLLHTLKDDRVGQHIPTLHLISELTIASVTFTTFNLGGHVWTRGVWKNYHPAINGIVFLVDWADHERLLESKESDTLMTNETIANVPVLIVGNKINRPEAIREVRIGVWFKWSDNGKGQCISERTECPALISFPVQCAHEARLRRRLLLDGTVYWLTPTCIRSRSRHSSLFKDSIAEHT